MLVHENTRALRSFDWTLFLLTLLIACVGLLFVMSATYTPDRPFSFFFKKQLCGVISGALIYLCFSYIDYHRLMRWAYAGYVGIVFLLLFTLIMGHTGMGAKRWLSFAFFRLQPAELAKVIFPAYAAYYLYTYKDAAHFCELHFIPLLAVLCASFLLILKQPDLGTAIIVASCGLVLLWFAGMPKKWFLWGFICCAIGTPFLWHVVLRPYQKRRITVFLGQGSAHKERYQIDQSLIAVGSGGIAGKGLLKGTQNKFRFLPESRTDFIFAVLCEEWGFLGACLLLLLYILLFMRVFAITSTIHSPHVQLLAIGILTHFVLSVIINLSMVLGLLPIVGIPLPLMSYGISNLWVTFASLGWFQSIAMRKSRVAR
jgi:rod shape determining protein RodA